MSQVAPFREEGMGWGLKLAEDLPKGSLVGEYVGEVRGWKATNHGSPSPCFFFLVDGCTLLVEKQLRMCVVLEALSSRPSIGSFFGRGANEI